MHKILVSSCLLGKPVRYDAKAKTFESDILDFWQAEGRLVSVCPEILGGLPTPRPPAEILDVSKIVDNTGTDVTAPFLFGAKRALEIAKTSGCSFALFTDGSPSCGSGYIYDGTFSGQWIDGQGVVTALLRKHGIQVFSPTQIDRLAQIIRA